MNKLLIAALLCFGCNTARDKFDYCTLECPLPTACVRLYGHSSLVSGPMLIDYSCDPDAIQVLQVTANRIQCPIRMPPK